MTEMITEDTPDDGEEMWQYKIDNLNGIIVRRDNEIIALNKKINSISQRLDESVKLFTTLTGRLTIKALRDAGVRVSISVADLEDDDYEDDD